VNDLRHKDRLLADILGEVVSAEFRESLLNETLRSARRHRRRRQVRGLASALAVVALLAFLLWHLSPPGRGPSGRPAKPYQLVRTQPLPRAAWVGTKPFPPAGLVSSAATGQIVLTVNAARVVHEITDDELLALVSKPAALVRLGPHSAELVFVNAEDRDEVLRN
jgi:hypothetical protein